MDNTEKADHTRNADVNEKPSTHDNTSNPDKSRDTSTDLERATTPEFKSTSNATAGPPAHVFAEGGQRAWLVVVGAWCAMFFTFGYLNAFG
jgi:hypothetical protein